jgi:uncharacterized protein YraI
MRRSLTLITVLALALVACGPSEVTGDDPTTTTTQATTTSVPGSTTGEPNGSTTTEPVDPPVVAGAWSETRSRIPDGVVLMAAIPGSPGLVAPGWYDKVPGVRGARSGLWFSADGSVWEEVTPTDLDLEWVEYQGGVWTGSEFLIAAEGIMNGVNTGSAIEGDGPLLFRSNDGRTWTVDVVDAALVAAAPSLGRLHMTPELIQAAGKAGFTDIIAGPDGLLVSGWLNTADGTLATIWSSRDGNGWTVRALPDADSNVRADQIERGPLGFMVKGGQQVIGGAGGIVDVLWRSADGRTWELVNDQASEYPGTEPLIPELWYIDAIAVGTTGYVMSGSLWSDPNAISVHVWFSATGTNWTEVEAFPGQDPYVMDIEGHRDGFIAVGCQTINSEPVGSVWHSSDGSSWLLESTTYATACIEQIEQVGGRWMATGYDGHPDPAFNPSEFWRPSELIVWTEPVTGAARSVVLVAADDVLNVRSGPGAANDVVTTLSATTSGIPLTGREEQVGSSTWVEIATHEGTGWVNSYYLAEPESSANAFTDAHAVDLADQIAAVFTGRGDLTEASSRRGIFVTHHDRARSFTNLDELLSDTTLYAWAGTGCSPEECPDETPHLAFAEAVADSFLGAWNDEDRQVAVDEVIPGGNGLLPDAIVPTEFENLHFIAVKDPGDNPDYDGIDWYTWYLYFTYENEVPVLLGMSIDEWAP